MIRNAEFDRILWPLSGNKLKICNLLRFFFSLFVVLHYYDYCLCFFFSILISYFVVHVKLLIHLVRLRSAFCANGSLCISLTAATPLSMYCLLVDVNQMEKSYGNVFNGNKERRKKIEGESNKKICRSARKWIRLHWYAHGWLVGWLNVWEFFYDRQAKRWIIRLSPEPRNSCIFTENRENNQCSF